MSDRISLDAFNIKRGFFRISDFCIEQKPPEQEIAGFIIHCHIVPMNRVRTAFGLPIEVSKLSGYRPRAYEISKKRPGTSQHNFEEDHEKGTGAADYTCTDVADLIPFIIEHTSYTRICHYPNNNFVHCDYKPTPSGKREVYTCDSPTSKWKLDYIIDEE